MDTDISSKILDEIGDSEYIEVLRPLLKNKEKSIRANNAYEQKMKLIKFAIGRGFTMDIIRQCIENVDDED
jgi:regulatory protein